MSVSDSGTDAVPGGTRAAIGEDAGLGVDPARMDDVFHVLQNARRRLVLAYLSDVEGPVEMRAIAEQVAAWENGTTVEAITSEQRQRVYIALYQSHLPKMDDLGVVDYDQARGVVERTPQVDRLLSFLPPAGGDPDADTTEGDGTADAAGGADGKPDAERAPLGGRLAWTRYALLLATAGGAVLAAAAFDAGPFAALPDALAGAAILASFVVLTAARAARDRRSAASRTE